MPKPIILEVEHITTYRYRKPVEFSTHRIAFHPRAAHDIRVLHVGLEVSPHSRQHWIHDVFSNSVVIVEPLIPSDELRFTARFTVEHYGVKNDELPIAKEAEIYPFDYSAAVRDDLGGFLVAQYPEDAVPVRDWVATFLPTRGRIHTRDVLANISEAISGDFRYAARTAMGTQRPVQTLELRQGTCRDFALLMMEAVRGLGLAARFVSGYVYDPALDTLEPPTDGTPVDSPNGGLVASQDAGGTVGSGATHAWLHVFLPGAGWIPFDPTNKSIGSTDLIRSAYTRTPEQAAPVSGSWTGAASDFIDMTVEVKVRRKAALSQDSTV